MDDSLIRFFAPHTQEEESLLRGEPLAQGRYTDRSAFIVEGERFVPSRQMISLRPHTRFADFPMHWHDYVEMMYMLQGETLHGMPTAARCACRRASCCCQPPQRAQHRPVRGKRHRGQLPDPAGVPGFCARYDRHP